MAATRNLTRRLSFLLALLAVTVSTLTVTAYSLWRLRSEAVARNFDAAIMFARTFEEHLTQTMNVVDLTLNSLGDEAAHAEAMEVALSAALRHAPYLRSLAALDRGGHIVASSEPRNLGLQVTDGDFLPSPGSPRAILRAGVPWAGRDFHDGRPVTPQRPAAAEERTLLPVRRDVTQSDGTWTTLLAAVNTDYFLNYYGRNLDAERGVVELLRYDGTLLLSTDAQQTPGIRLSSSRLAERLTREEFGHFEDERGNGGAVLSAYRASRVYPFVIAVHLDKALGLAAWRNEAERTLLFVAAALIAALALASLYYARMERVAQRRDADLDQLRLLRRTLEASANAIMISDHQGRIEWANPAFCRMTGYDIEETLGRNPRELIKSGRQAGEHYADLWQTILAGKVWRGELINRRKDGSDYLEDQTITPVLDKHGAIRRFIAIKQDITERRQNERRMEELSRHLIVVQESARRRLSGELHDRTSPNLAAISINLDIIATAAASLPQLTERLEDVRALVEDTTASIREICSDLRPPVLDYAGLAAAVDSYVVQFRRRTGIEVALHCPQSGARLAPTLESMLFRIVQEALTNCAKHSRASRIAVSLELDTTVRLEVSDDGVGFEPGRLGATTHTGGLGMLTMREMTEFCGGRFSLDARPGQGTCISVEIDTGGGQA